MSVSLGNVLREARQAKGLEIVQLATELGVSASAVSQWESGKTRPGMDNLRRVCDILGLQFASVSELYHGPRLPGIKTNAFTSEGEGSVVSKRTYKGSMLSANVERVAQAPAFSSFQGLARDVPVRGIAVGGDDADFQMNGQENDWAPRPPGLAGVRGLFALIVSNDSMYPAWRPNAIFYINPTRAPQIGDDVVVEMLPDDSGDPGKAFLKRLKARTPTKIIVEQFNPPKDIEFDRNEVRLYRVVPWEEALGIS